MNNQKAPFNDVRVRQAINYAIDKDAYCAVVKNGYATPAKSVIGSAVQFYKANDPYPYDIEKAKQLLDEGEVPRDEIPYSVGFSDPKYFYKCFKEETGINMTEYTRAKL